MVLRMWCCNALESWEIQENFRKKLTALAHQISKNFQLFIHLEQINQECILAQMIFCMEGTMPYEIFRINFQTTLDFVSEFIQFCSKNFFENKTLYFLVFKEYNNDLKIYPSYLHFIQHKIGLSSNLPKNRFKIVELCMNYEYHVYNIQCSLYSIFANK